MSDHTTDSDAVEQLADEIDIDHVADRLEGRDGSLRSSKPDTDADDGLVQYVWRMARFHAGADTTMPVTASWWLQGYLDDAGIDASVTGITDDDGTAVTEYLDAVTDAVLLALGEDPGRAAERWAATGALAVEEA